MPKPSNQTNKPKVSKKPNKNAILTQRPQGKGKRLTQSEKLIIYSHKGSKTSRAVGLMYGITHATVQQIWNDERMASHQAEIAIIKESMAGNLYRTAHHSIEQVNNKLPEANAYQSALIAGICIDKARLLEGKTTQNHGLIGYINLINNTPV
jgi:hypothetical protein